MVKKKKTPKKKEEVCEIFKIEKDGKSEVKEVCGVEEQKISKKDQIKEENKILRNILIGVGILVLSILIWYWLFMTINNFEYKDVEYQVIKEGQVIFYYTSFKGLNQAGDIVTYNFGIRNDPRKLDKIPFEGEIDLREMMVLENTDSFSCEGDGGIAMINLQQILGALGANVIKDPDAGCDPQGRYGHIKIDHGEVTEIKKTGTACYELYVNDCEILKVTEKFIVESLSKYTN